MNDKASAGRRGPKVRSDCWVEIEPRKSGGLRITLRSKVEPMFGRAIRKLVREELRFFGIEHCRVQFEDAGALPFVQMARVEAAVKRLNPKEKREYLPELRECCARDSPRDRFRRSRLYLPGNEPKFMLNAGVHRPDGVILDLEDSVAPSEKDAALILVRNALRQVDFMGAERMVRINQLPAGLDELDALVGCGVDLVLIPKCEDAKMVRAVDKAIRQAKKTRKSKSPVWLIPIVESCLGVFNALEVARASKNIVGLTIGLEDYTADLGTQRTDEAKESFWARSQVVNAARAAGVQPIDTVYSDVGNMDGLRASVEEAKSMGYVGKGCIHPRQIRVVHEAFAPTEKETDRAKRIVLAFRKAEVEGLAAVSLGSKMIDPPVVKRALRTVGLAQDSGLLPEDWDREEGGAQ